MHTDLRSQPRVAWVPDRRRSPRLQVLGEIHGYALNFDLPVALKDISAGGFSIEGPIRFPLGAIHEFRFVRPDETFVQLRAVVVHQLRIAAGDQAPAFLVGLQFLDTTEPDVEAQVQALLGSVAA